LLGGKLQRSSSKGNVINVMEALKTSITAAKAGKSAKKAAKPKRKWLSGAPSIKLAQLVRYHLPPPPGWTEEFDGAVMPVLVLLRFPTALFRVFDEPGVPAGQLLPVVPWLFALLAFAPDAPPVPFLV
jgi:hypothetical protein